jgi:DNA-binding NarL/FixJ family response regulator
MTARENVIKVLVADDQKLFREMLIDHLRQETDIEVVGEAESGAETLEKAAALTPDILLLDIQLGDMDGLEVTEKVKEQVPAIKVVLLTGFHNEEYIYRGFQVGASGYLSKDTSLERVLDAVRRAYEGDALLEPVATTRIIRHFDQHQPRASRRTETKREPVKLTPRENEILALIADGLSNQEIAERLFISEYTVKTHVSNLFRKLGINDRVQAVLYALEVGLR